MSELKRYYEKYVRDRAKSRYQKGTECYICAATENLDFHHYTTLSVLLDKWRKEKGYSEEDVLEWRDEFIDTHTFEMYENTVTLCHTHHLKLHSVYGKNPALFTAPKQKNWVNIQRKKHGLDTEDS